MPNVIQTDHQADPKTPGLHRCQMTLKLIIKPTQIHLCFHIPNDTQTDHQADPNTSVLHRCQMTLKLIIDAKSSCPKCLYVSPMTDDAETDRQTAFPHWFPCALRSDYLSNWFSFLRTGSPHAPPDVTHSLRIRSLVTPFFSKCPAAPSPWSSGCFSKT